MTGGFEARHRPMGASLRGVHCSDLECPLHVDSGRRPRAK